jgi:hypothetical protein
MDDILRKVEVIVHQIDKISEDLASISETEVVSYDEDTTTSTTSYAYDPIEEDTDRMDVVGQNGNDGLHYEEMDMESSENKRARGVAGY